MQSVTSAPPSRRDDQQQRMRNYLVSMGLRTVCFVLAVFFIAVLDWQVIGWTCAVLAAVLPYFAVLLANAARHRSTEAPGSVPPLRGQLPPGSDEDGQHR